MNKKDRLLYEWKRFKAYGINLVFLSVLTGIFAGVAVTFYNICTSFGEDCARSLYALIVRNPAFIPLLFIGLAAGAVVIGTLVRFIPMIRGSGIPQIEGAARGIFGFKWYVVMCAMFASSLACVFMGLPAGAEGPSIEIGGCAGEAVGSTLKRSQMIKRLQIAGGASAGFAVAFNAPVTGLIFSLEEAFRSFSPQVFICSAVSVISALLVRNGIRSGLGFSVGYAFDGFEFANIDISAYGFVALAALIVSFASAGYYYLMLATKKAFKKITFFKGAGKFIIPFALAGAFGLITPYSIGGGHSFIHDISTGGTGNITIQSVFGLGVAASLVVIVLIRFISMTVVSGCGVPVGAFIPMLAVGAGLGAVLAVAFQAMGMDAAFSDYLIIICMAAFFTCFVRAPITGICMIFELTGQFQNFLPAVLGIVIAYLVSELCRLQPGYEKCLSMFIEEEGYLKNAKKIRLRVKVCEGSQADGGKVRKIIWPANGLVVDVTKPDGSTAVPDGETMLYAGETITFECETGDEERLKEYLYEIVGRPED